MSKPDTTPATSASRHTPEPWSINRKLANSVDGGTHGVKLGAVRLEIIE